MGSRRTTARVRVMLGMLLALLWSGMAPSPQIASAADTTSAPATPTTVKKKKKKHLSAKAKHGKGTKTAKHHAWKKGKHAHTKIVKKKKIVAKPAAPAKPLAVATPAPTVAPTAEPTVAPTPLAEVKDPTTTSLAAKPAPTEAPKAKPTIAAEKPADDPVEPGTEGGLDYTTLLACAGGGLAVAGGVVYMRRKRKKGTPSNPGFEGTGMSQLPGSFHGTSLHGGSLHGSSLTAEGTSFNGGTGSSLAAAPIGAPEPKSQPPRTRSSHAEDDDDDGSDTDPRGGGKKKAKKGEPAKDAKRSEAPAAPAGSTKVVAQAPAGGAFSPAANTNPSGKELPPTQLNKLPQGAAEPEPPTKSDGKTAPAPFERWVEMRVAQEVWAERGEPAAANLQGTFGVSLIDWVKVNAYWNERFLADPALKSRHDELAPTFRGKYAKGAAA